MSDEMPIKEGHNHAQRSIMDRGECSGCDEYWAKYDAPKPPGPGFPPRHPFNDPVG